MLGDQNHSGMHLTGIRSYRFQNWSQTYGCYPEIYFEPESLEDVRQVLQLAHKNNKNVRVVGSGCSPSSLACSEDYMISMKKFDKILQIDQEHLTIEVQAGIRISKLNEIMERNGLALPVLPTISDITLAGMISTGTHGSGIKFGCLSSYVIQMEIMMADGTLKKVTSSDGEVFEACRLSLGCLGVIVSVICQCQPAYKLSQCSYRIHYRELIECMDVHVSSSDHFRFHWYPHTDMCQVQHIGRTNQPVVKRLRIPLFEYLIGFVLHQGLMWISCYLPIMIPWFNKFWFWTFKSRHDEAIDISHKIFNFNCLYRQYVMEWAIPAKEAGAFLNKLVEWTKRTKYPAHSPVEFRFSKGDNILLSPSYGRDTCYVNIICWRPFGKDIPHDMYWNQVEKIALEEHGGRPHWAKDHNMIAKDLQILYPEWNVFLKIRKTFDPNGIFINGYLKRTFDM